MLELGCGNSSFMGYFATRFGYEVSGIDFSENGCRMIKEILKRDQVKGEVFQGDIFNPPDNLIEQFDMVCAFGVLEHFSDTTQTISAFSRFLKPGGILLISIPNFAGLTGFILKKGNRKLYDHHVILTKKALQNAVPGSVLKLIKCQYYVPFYLALFLDFLNEKKGGLKALKIIFSRGLSLLNKIIWWIEIKTGIQLPDSQLFSAGIFLTAEKPENQKGD